LNAGPPPSAAAIASPAPATRPVTPITPDPARGPCDPASAEFWPRVLAAAASNRRARVLLEGSACVAVARKDAKSAAARVRVLPELLAAFKNAATELDAIASLVAGHSITIEPFADAPAIMEPATPRANINDHPLVKSALELFKARVLSVQARQPAEK
jgi:hypothetical protein